MRKKTSAASNAGKLEENFEYKLYVAYRKKQEADFLQ